MIYVKMTKFSTKIGLFVMHIFIFFCIWHKEYLFFTKLCVIT
jgi:hypothetical protein